MGRPRILNLSTSITRKAWGQMNKLLDKWHDKPKEGNPDFLYKNQRLSAQFITRRQIVLNRHFTEIISDILLVSFKRSLEDLGVRITSIETKAWNKGVRIYYHTNKPYCKETHDKLNQSIPDLKRAITEQNLVGRTPEINFVYDKDAALDSTLDQVFDSIEIKPVEQSTDLQRLPEDQLQRIRRKVTKENEYPLNPKNFSAPSDMSNMTLGLDYVGMYDEVIRKLGRGRGESSRMAASSDIAPIARPIFRESIPIEPEVEDARSRVLNMQKFMVSQKKKNEYLSRARRKEELMGRDKYKWDPAPEEDDYDEPDPTICDKN